MMMGIMLCLGLDTLRKKAAHRREATVCAPFGLLIAYFVAVALLGGAIELLQAAMQLGRSKDWADFVADVAGAAVGWIVCLAAWPSTVRWLRRLPE